MLATGIVPNRPAVKVTSLADIKRLEEDKAAQQTTQTATIFSETSLGAHIRLAWDRNKMAKEKITLRLLENLRARRGVYSAAQLQMIQDKGGLNVIFVELTEEKCKAAGAWVREVVMPVGDFPFSIDPSPVPDLPHEMKMQIVQKASMAAQKALVDIGQAAGVPQGQDGQPQPRQVMDQDTYRALAADIGKEMRDQIQHDYLKEAKEAAEKMQLQIEDYMAEGGWDDAIDAFIEDFVTYPAAVMMGPVYERANQLEWGAGLTPHVNRNPQMRWNWVDIFDVYPAQFTKDCQTGDFIVRKRYTRRELFDCIGVDDYRKDQIEAALLAYSNGHLEGWIWQEAERQRLQQESLYSWLAPRGVIDAIHFWGSVPGWKLQSWGVKNLGELDPVEEYEVDAILIGPYVIRCAVNRDPLKRRPFFNASFDAIPGSFWGRGVADLADTCQKMVNACACALADNMGWAAGPMAWVHVDRLADGENAMEIIPRKIWQLKSDPTQGVNPGVGFFQAASNADEFMKLIDQWSIKADDSTGVPRYTYGNERVGGAADTYSGLSMLMNNAAKGLRRAISQIDGKVIRPSMYMAFINEMVFGKDDSLKADCVVVPKGATAMLVREARNQALLSGAQLTSNPIDAQIIGAKGRANLLRKVFQKALEIDPEGIVPTDREIEQTMAQQAQQAQQQAQMTAQVQTAGAQATVAAAKINADSREKTEGAKLAANARQQDSKNAPKKLAFSYDNQGNIAEATQVPQPAQSQDAALTNQPGTA